MLDRLVWFLRNVDLTQGLEKIIGHYREGITQVAAALDGALSKPAAAAREARVAELARAGVPEALARQIASLTVLKAAPDIVLVADRAGKPVNEVTATYFATEAFFQLDQVASAVPTIVVSDYFDRLALDRALDSIGDAERRLTAAMVGNGHAGAGAVEEWVRPRQAEVERIRSAIHKSPGRALRCRNCQSRRACWAIWRGTETCRSIGHCRLDPAIHDDVPRLRIRTECLLQISWMPGQPGHDAECGPTV